MELFNPTGPSPGPATTASSDDRRRDAARFFPANQLVGVLFLVSQVIFVLQTHFFADSARLLTPVEGLMRYEVHATLAQQPLTASEIHGRYGIALRDDAALTVAAVRAAIIHRETRIPVASALYVRLRTREADGTEDYWLWPQE